MVYGLDIKTDFNKVIDEIGGSVTVFELFTSGGAGSYNIYGDFVLSGANLYVSGVTAIASIQPRTQEDLSIQEWGNRVDGDMVGYFKSGVNLSIGFRVSGVRGDYKINAISPYWVNNNLCYNLTLLDRLNK